MHSSFLIGFDLENYIYVNVVALFQPSALRFHLYFRVSLPEYFKKHIAADL